MLLGSFVFGGQLMSWEQAGASFVASWNPNNHDTNLNHLTPPFHHEYHTPHVSPTCSLDNDDPLLVEALEIDTCRDMRTWEAPDC